MEREQMRQRFSQVIGILRETKKISLSVFGEEYLLEYVHIPAVTPDGAAKPIIFNHPGGGTHLSRCLEPFVWADRESITLSPLGYGRSSALPEKERNNPIDFPAEAFTKFVSALAERPYELYGHSNAATIVAATAQKLYRKTACKQVIWLVNPLGIRPVPAAAQAVLFPLFGILSRMTRGACSAQMGREMLRAYTYMPMPQKRRSLLFYEMQKGQSFFLPYHIQNIRAQGCTVRVVRSAHDWALLWAGKNTLSLNCDEEYRIQGFHNITIGEGAREIAKILSC